MDGVWSGAERSAFQDVISTFHRRYPNVTVKFRSTGDNTPTVLAKAVAGGHPPDLADVAQPGLIKQFAGIGALKPETYALSSYSANFDPAWVEARHGQRQVVRGRVQGVEQVDRLVQRPRVQDRRDCPPTTWQDFLSDAKTLKVSGTRGYSIGGADGWTLTDLFENVYLRQAGVAKYRALSDHTIKWTDPTVKNALRTIAAVFGDTSNIYGGTSGALHTDFPTSVNNVFRSPPKAAMVMEGDFVPGVATVKATPVTDYNVFAFPSINGSGPEVEIGGDTIVALGAPPRSKRSSSPDDPAGGGRVGQARRLRHR